MLLREKLNNKQRQSDSTPVAKIVFYFDVFDVTLNLNYRRPLLRALI